MKRTYTIMMVICVVFALLILFFDHSEDKMIYFAGMALWASIYDLKAQVAK